MGSQEGGVLNLVQASGGGEGCKEETGLLTQDLELVVLKGIGLPC